MNLIKYELKEKDLDIVQLQKEINELQLENKMLKAKMPLNEENLMLNLNEDEMKLDIKNPYVINYLFSILFLIVFFTYIIFKL
jgi:hypothetical protein